MNVYTINDRSDCTQVHCVVAESMAEAERIYKAKYRPVTIKSIELYSEYVQIQKHDEQTRQS